MGRCLFLVAVLVAITIPACNQSGITGPSLPAPHRISSFETGMIVVYVHWQEQGVADKKVDLLDTGRSEVTNDGGIARFRVEPGSYVVRVHDLNRGGPVFQYVDFKVSVGALKQTTLDVVDCLPCD